MTLLDEKIRRANDIAVVGHANPDGDCAGSCLAVYNYIRERGDGRKVTVYLEPVPARFSYLSGYGEIRSTLLDRRDVDLCVCLDSADRERLGGFAALLDAAADSICIDHHVTNPGYARDNVIDPRSSSTCELLYLLMDDRRVSRPVAECLYTGIVTDSGVFRYGSTTPRTMEIAGKLMGKGIDFSGIIDGGFYRKTYRQSQIMGRALLDSVLFLDGRGVFSVVSRKDMALFGADRSDLDGIAEQLRLIDGVECAVLISETGSEVYKVSLRSKDTVDVSRIAAYFGGGGHPRAAGCTMKGSAHDVINNLSLHIEEQLRENGSAKEAAHGGE